MKIYIVFHSNGCFEGAYSNKEKANERCKILKENNNNEIFYYMECEVLD